MRYILWSGGFDSTYLLCRRARETGEIQPVYILMNGRSCSDIELQCQKELLPLIRGKEGCKAEIKEPVIVKENDLPQHGPYQEAYNHVALQAHVGSLPFLRLMGLSAELYPAIEIGIEAPAPGVRKIGRLENYLRANGIDVDDDGNLSFRDSDPDVKRLFQNMRFPIMHVNGSEEWEDFRTWGWEDIARNTRTCVSPLPRQCGVCGNCETKLNYGDTFSWMFDDQARKDHAIKTYLMGKNERHAMIFMWYVEYGHTLSKTDHIRPSEAKKLTAYFDDMEKTWPEVPDAPDD